MRATVDHYAEQKAALDRWYEESERSRQEIHKNWRWVYVMLGASGVMAVASALVPLAHWYGVSALAVGAAVWIYGVVRWLLQYRVYSKAKAASKAAEAEYYRIK